MSCGPERTTFRVLDRYAGWDALDHKDLGGLDEDAAGLQLERTHRGLTDAELMPLLLPPRLARGCGRCDWYLITPAPARLMRRDACSQQWMPLWTAACDPGDFIAPTAVAASGHRIAVLDPAAQRIVIWSGDGARVSAAIRVADVAAIGFTAWGELLVAIGASGEVLRFGPDGSARGVFAKLPPGAGVPEHITAGDDCTVWIVTRSRSGALQLWRASREHREFTAAGVDALESSVGRSGVKVHAQSGFCLESLDANGVPRTFCYLWYGRAIDEADVPRPPIPVLYETRGQLLTHAIDSGIPRCCWHRVRVEADMPEGTKLLIAVASSEDAGTNAQGDPTADPVWKNYPAGAPHPLDWQEAPAGSVDFLIDQPAGRYLFLRLRLTGDGTATPLVKRVLLDFPRSTSLELLPAVYRENPDAEKFTARFLALFDASIGELDRAIERFPAMLDVGGAPDDVLAWLGSFLDLAFDPAWEPTRRREILRALPRLYRARGTVSGLTSAIRLVFDADVAIQELPHERAWGALGRTTRIGGVRLFGKARARIRLGRSPLGRAPLKSFGDPDRDPLADGAYRFRVLVPPGNVASTRTRERLRDLIERQKPAHTIATVRMGGTGLVLGAWSTMGVDTVLAPLPAPVLGAKGRPDAAGNVRLSRMSVLRPKARGARGGVIAGGQNIVGNRIVME